MPAPFTFGNSARTMPDARSHGINNFDFTLFKNTKITERVGLQFRDRESSTCSIAFGLVIREPRWATPQFGVVSGQYNDPRLMQFALRLIF